MKYLIALVHTTAANVVAVAAVDNNDDDNDDDAFVDGDFIGDMGIRIILQNLTLTK